MSRDWRTLPAGLPEPVDDGAAAGLPGRPVPRLTLPSTHGAIDLTDFCSTLAVVYVYPRTGVPGVALPPGWDAIPGARGCTPQSCAFRDLAAELADAGARVAGLSAQPLDEQLEFAGREAMPFPLLSDPGLRLAAALGLPTFGVAGMTLYRRLTFVAERARISRVFYPVFPPDRNAADVLEWLRGAAA